MTATGNSTKANQVNRTRIFILLGVVVILVALAILAGIYLSDYEVLKKGKLLPYTDGIIYKVRFHDTFTLFLEPEELSFSDLLNIFVMTGIGFTAFTFSIVIDSLATDTNQERFWFFILMFVGMSFLTADEALGLHESLGHNLQFLGRLPFIKHPDDAIILSYGIPAAAFLLLFRKFILAERRALLLFGLGFFVFLVSGLSDALAIPFEELLEPLASVFIYSGVFSLGLYHVHAVMNNR